MLLTMSGWVGAALPGVLSVLAGGGFAIDRLLGAGHKAAGVGLKS